MVCMCLMVLSFTSLWSSALLFSLTIANPQHTLHALPFPILLTLSNPLSPESSGQLMSSGKSIYPVPSLQRKALFPPHGTRSKVTLFFKATHSLMTACLLFFTPSCQQHHLYLSFLSCFSLFLLGSYPQTHACSSCSSLTKTKKLESSSLFTT